MRFIIALGGNRGDVAEAADHAETLLADVPVAVLLGSILAYRLIYYLIPLLLALVLVGHDVVVFVWGLLLMRPLRRVLG